LLTNCVSPIPRKTSPISPATSPLPVRRAISPMRLDEASHLLQHFLQNHRNVCICYDIHDESLSKAAVVVVDAALAVLEQVDELSLLDELELVCYSFYHMSA